MTEEQKQSQKLRRESKKATRTPEQNRAALRRKVRIFYDLQRLRIQTAGRTLDRATEIELHEVDVAILDNRAKDLHKAEREAFHDIETHLKTMPAYTNILADKEAYKGIGPTMAGVMLSEIDIKRAQTPSALWRYAGLATTVCRRCKTCKDPVTYVPHSKPSLYKHQFNRQVKCIVGNEIPEGKTYESSQAERGQKGTKLPYNRFFKTKLVGVAADCLIKAVGLDSHGYYTTRSVPNPAFEKGTEAPKDAERVVIRLHGNASPAEGLAAPAWQKAIIIQTPYGGVPWRKFYDDYKHRLVSAGKGRDDGHRHMMAKRYMIKMLLLELWTRWRELEGLEVRVPYAEQYLGVKHHGKGVA